METDENPIMPTNLVSVMSTVCPSAAVASAVDTAARCGSASRGASFESHLQNARYEAPADSDRNASADDGDDCSAQTASVATGMADCAGSKTSGQDAAASDQTVAGTDPSAADADSSDDAAAGNDAGSFAAQLLGLVEQAPGDTRNGVDPQASTGTTSKHAGKTGSATANPSHAIASVSPPLLASAPVVPQATNPVMAGASGDAGANVAIGGVRLTGMPGTGDLAAVLSDATDASVGNAGANAAIGGVRLVGMPGTGGLAAVLSDATDASINAVTDASAGGAADTASALLQGISDGAQALLGGPASLAHLAGAVATTAVSSRTPASSSGSSVVLAGSVGAGAVAVTPVVIAIATHALTVNTPVGSSGFSQQLSQQVTWLSGQAVKQAQIRLHPQDLGTLDVKVSVEHGRVDVAFVTQHPDVSTAVRQGLDQLSQMLGNQGLSLGHATVGQQGGQQFAQTPGGTSASGQNGQSAESTDDNGAISSVQRVAIGLVDAFA